MPWSQTSPMDQRTQFIADYLRETFSIVELCECYGVGRKTGYKWIDRYLRLGPPGLEEYSRRPRQCPRQTPGKNREPDALNRFRSDESRRSAARSLAMSSCTIS